MVDFTRDELDNLAVALQIAFKTINKELAHEDDNFFYTLKSKMCCDWLALEDKIKDVLKHDSMLDE